MSSDKLSVILTSVPSKEVAEEISNTIVSEDLAACVQIVPSHISIYKWEGKIQKDEEVLLVIKTPSSLYKALENRLIELHPYETPEVVELEAKNVAEKYLNWALEVSKK